MAATFIIFGNGCLLSKMASNKLQLKIDQNLVVLTIIQCLYIDYKWW